MKLTISTLACPNWTLDQIIDGCAQAGAHGVDFRGIGDELDITNLPAFNADLDQTLSRLRDAGLELPCFNTSIKVVEPDSQKWNVLLEECQRYAQLASRTGTLYLRIFGGHIPEGMTRDEARALGERHLRQLSKICRTHGCLPVLETHDAWKTSDEVLELIHALTPEEVGVLWDIEHPFGVGEAPRQTAQRLARYLRHIHVKDTTIVDGKRDARLLGEGSVPIRECVQAAQDAGYNGWWALETEKRWLTDAPEPEQSIPQFVQYMRAL